MEGGREGRRDGGETFSQNYQQFANSSCTRWPHALGAVPWCPGEQGGLLATCVTDHSLAQNAGQRLASQCQRRLRHHAAAAQICHGRKSGAHTDSTGRLCGHRLQQPPPALSCGQAGGLTHQPPRLCPLGGSGQQGALVRDHREGAERGKASVIPEPHGRSPQAGRTPPPNGSAPVLGLWLPRTAPAPPSPHSSDLCQ